MRYPFPVRDQQQPQQKDFPRTDRVYIFLEAYIPHLNQDWCRACNDHHIQNSFAIYQHQTRLIANYGVNIDYYVDEPTSEANLMILQKPSNKLVKTRSTIKQFEPQRQIQSCPINSTQIPSTYYSMLPSKRLISESMATYKVFLKKQVLRK